MWLAQLTPSWSSSFCRQSVLRFEAWLRWFAASDRPSLSRAILDLTDRLLTELRRESRGARNFRYPPYECEMSTKSIANSID